MPCQFPFIYKGKTYYSCTYDNFDDFSPGVPSDFDGQPWCSVATDLENNHIWSQYGICDDFELCPLPQPTSTFESGMHESMAKKNIVWVVVPYGKCFDKFDPTFWNM